MERYPAGTALEFGNEQESAAKIHVADSETQRLPESQSRAVQNEEQCSIQKTAEPRPIEAPYEKKQKAHLRQRKEGSRKPRLVGQVRPQRLAQKATGIEPTKVPPQLAQNRELG
jgi:hypothetical protein